MKNKKKKPIRLSFIRQTELADIFRFCIFLSEDARKYLLREKDIETGKIYSIEIQEPSTLVISKLPKNKKKKRVIYREHVGARYNNITLKDVSIIHEDEGIVEFGFMISELNRLEIHRLLGLSDDERVTETVEDVPLHLSALSEIFHNLLMGVFLEDNLVSLPLKAMGILFHHEREFGLHAFVYQKNELAHIFFVMKKWMWYYNFPFKDKISNFKLENVRMEGQDLSVKLVYGGDIYQVCNDLILEIPDKGV